jgi:hypothetical protein
VLPLEKGELEGDENPKILRIENDERRRITNPELTPVGLPIRLNRIVVGYLKISKCMTWLRNKKSDVSSQGTGNKSLTPKLTSDSANKVKYLIHNTQEDDKKNLIKNINHPPVRGAVLFQQLFIWWTT